MCLENSNLMSPALVSIMLSPFLFWHFLHSASILVGPVQMFLSRLGLVLHLRSATASPQVQPATPLLIFPTQHIFFHKFYYQTLYLSKMEIIVVSKNDFKHILLSLTALFPVSFISEGTYACIRVLFLLKLNGQNTHI